MVALAVGGEHAARYIAGVICRESRRIDDGYRGFREGFGQRNIRLDVTAEAKAKLAELGHSPKYGARPLERVLEERVMAPVAVELARRPKLRNAVARVTLEGDDVRVTFGAGA